jgi:hypothetical protein
MNNATYEQNQALLDLSDKLYALAEALNLNDDWAHRQLETLRKEAQTASNVEVDYRLA